MRKEPISTISKRAYIDNVKKKVDRQLGKGVYQQCGKTLTNDIERTYIDNVEMGLYRQCGKEPVSTM